MGCSCARCVGLIVLLMVMMACTISFVSPYWVTKAKVNTGLLGTCTGYLDPGNIGETAEKQCTWFSDDEFEWEKKLATWQISSQAMYGLAMLLLLVALPCACVSVCCDTYGNVSRATGLLLMIAGVFMVITFVVFGYFAHQDWEVIPFYNKAEGKYNWGYYMGVAGVILDFIVGGLFLCARKTE